MDSQVLTTPNNQTLDASGRERSGQPLVIYSGRFLSNKQPLYWDDQQVSGAGTTSTHNTNQSSVTIATTNATVGRRIRQTFRWFNYQPGISQAIMLTGILGVTTTSANFNRIGYYNDNNGFFFEHSDSTAKVVSRTYTSGAPVDTKILQSSWNLDKMDGSGGSRVTLDFSKTQLFYIDFQWLGTGRIRFGFTVNGMLIWCHQIQNANLLTVAYAQNVNLPLRYEIENTAITATANSVTQICSVVISESGSTQTTSFVRTVSTGLTPLVTINNSNWYPVLAIRLKSTQQYATLHIVDINIICTSTTVFQWRMWLNAVVSGTALNFADAVNITQCKNTSIDLATPTNATTLTEETDVSPGVVIRQGYTQAGNGDSLISSMGGNPTDLSLGSSIAGVSDILYIAVRRITGGAETFYATIIFDEHS